MMTLPRRVDGEDGPVVGEEGSGQYERSQRKEQGAPSDMTVRKQEGGGGLESSVEEFKISTGPCVGQRPGLNRLPGFVGLAAKRNEGRLGRLWG